MRDHPELVEGQLPSMQDCPSPNWFLQRSLVVKTALDLQDVTIYSDA
jgi:hypothetical protein